MRRLQQISRISKTLVKKRYNRTLCLQNAPNPCWLKDLSIYHSNSHIPILFRLQTPEIT
ncbi:Hypothetical protein BN2458_PEG0155 [Helicobacter typhlonius]|uniref:Uncharacterized protein n=1 Tax=Helicobacter typhlonius TaxID=76936 RepID=A0A0S4PUZ2_9HELI|nr:Hypothetical protein BN2458_PEG0155 [Helicobacter typhlonius]